MLWWLGGARRGRANSEMLQAKVRCQRTRVRVFPRHDVHCLEGPVGTGSAEQPDRGGLGGRHGTELTRWRVAGRRIATVATAVLVMVTVLPLGGWLYVPLETRFAAPRDMPAAVDGIILIGGATSPGLTARWDQPMLNQHSERLVAFVMLAHRYPDARLVLPVGRDRHARAGCAKPMWSNGCSPILALTPAGSRSRRVREIRLKTRR